MIDHVSLRVRDYPKLLAFYKAALAPLGYEVIMEFPGTAGLGQPGNPDFWITGVEKPTQPTHVAFRGTRAMIDQFYAAAVRAGAKNNGAPGIRADYHANYYAAFVLDPEGNNVEAVCHDPPLTDDFSDDTETDRNSKARAAGRKSKGQVKIKAAGKKAGKPAARPAAAAKKIARSGRPEKSKPRAKTKTGGKSTTKRR